MGFFRAVLAGLVLSAMLWAGLILSIYYIRRIPMPITGMDWMFLVPILVVIALCVAALRKQEN